MNRDLNYIAALEKAITEKYGELATKNPRAGWTEEKEQEYLQQTKVKLQQEARNEGSQELLDLDGILIPKKLISGNNKRKCETCQTYSFNRDDDVYFSKYDVCKRCYIKHIEDREERWRSGWRPNSLMENK